VSPILLTSNSKTGIFGIFSKRITEICHFQNGNSRRPCYKRDNKGNAARGNQLGFHHAALSCRPKFKGYIGPAITIEFCAIDKNESVSATSELVCL